MGVGGGAWLTREMFGGTECVYPADAKVVGQLILRSIHFFQK